MFMAEIHHIKHRGKIIEFIVTRKNVKHVNLTVRPDGTVIVSAHERVPIEFIENFIQEKASWIVKHSRYFEDARPENPGDIELVSGESVRYLGRLHRLKVAESDIEEIKYMPGYIYLYVRDKNNEKRKESLFKEWMRKQTAEVFEEALDKVYPPLQKYGVSKPEIRIRTMKARWGSCLKNSNAILLNFELIKAPKYCIEYVILHELIHFVHKNHDDQFYSFLAALMPDWKQRKAMLDEEVVREL
jgi:predicted metal-dependent hydrolase